MSKNIALYPGTFDPITFGHLDIIKRAAKIVDNLYIGVANNRSKKTLFKPKERVSIINSALKELPLPIRKKIKIVLISDLTVNYCKKIKATIIIRGLRVVGDFEYEFQLSGMNSKLNSSIQTIFLMADINNQVISSNMVKEIASLKGDVSSFAPKSAVSFLKKKYK